MACTLVQSYLHEISPVGLRGSLSVLHSIALASGLFVAQILGFEQILGKFKVLEIKLKFGMVSLTLNFHLFMGYGNFLEDFKSDMLKTHSDCVNLHTSL